MALHEADHPFAHELATIVTATEAGLPTSGLLPKWLALGIKNLDVTGDGVTEIVIGDDFTGNVSKIYVPGPEYNKTDLSVVSCDESVTTAARILTADANGESFALFDTGAVAPALQLDVLSDAVVFSAKPVVEATGQPTGRFFDWGDYDRDNYRAWTGIMREEVSITLLHTLSVEFLGQAA